MVARFKKIEGSSLAGSMFKSVRDAISFTVSNTIKIRGISLHRSHHLGRGTSTFRGYINLIDDSTGYRLYGQVFEISTDDQPSYVEQLFTSPQQVEKDKKYSIVLEYALEQEDLIWKSVDAVNPAVAACGGKDVTFNFFNSAYGTRVEGQIPPILFSC